MHASAFKRLTVAVVLASCTSFALAQYVWLNEKGVKQYSDMPPPASVSSGKILKSPDKLPSSNVAKKTTEQEKTNEKTVGKAAPTMAEKNADFQKRSLEQAEKDKEAAEKEKLAADKKRNCERAADYKRILDSGMRVTRMNQSGEHTYLSDEERTQETRDNDRTLLTCKQ